MSNYWRKKLEELNAENEKKSSNSSNSSQNYWQNKMDELEETNRKQSVPLEDIAPVKPTTTKSDDDRKWFQKGYFEDGYQFGDVVKTIGASLSDVAENIVTGVAGMGEKIVDAGLTLGAAMNQAQMQEAANNELVFNAVTGRETEGVLEKYQDYSELVKSGTAEFVAKDLYNEEEVAKTILTRPIENITGLEVESGSVFGEKSDSLVQSAGQLGVTVALQAAGVPWYLTTGLTTFGSETENAFNQGATFDEAFLSATISTGAELLTEKISGGISFGGKTLDSTLTKELSSGISNKVVQTLLKLGIDAVGEGSEEILSGVMSAIGQKLTYADEKELEELFTNEDAWESFIGGAVLGGGSSGIKAVKSNINGVDYVSGLTKNEQKVVDKVYEDRLAEAEKGGKKLTSKEKSKIYDEVMHDLEKGYISTDTIESVLGGETYKTYQDTISSEDALIKEYEELRNMKKGEMNDIQQDRLAELKAMNLTDTTKRDSLKTQLSDEVMKSLTRNVKGKTQADNYLIESYNERSRRGQAFEADLSQYDAKQQETIKKAVESGILNNTNRTHEFVDMIAKISADKGVLFDFTNNAKLKESGFAVDGATVNGYVTKDGITVNIDSTKSWNSVVGHEITHVLEGTELYTEMQNALFEYAKSKGDYQGRYDSLTKLYEGVEGANVDAELTADLVGDYLFTDTDFVKNLSVQHRNVFQKIYDEIKYMLKVATAGSKEARELERVKRAFDQAYKESGKADGETKYSLSDSDGKTLTKEQSEYFKDSKAVDKNGNLLKVYHTTNNDFTVFDKARKGDATGDANTYLGFFFSDDAEFMQNFPEFKDGKTEAYYLNITNPIDMTDISRDAFLDIVEVMGGDVQEASDLYDQSLAAEQERARRRGDNNTSLLLSNLLYDLTGDYDYADFFEELKPHYDELMSRGYDGVVNYLDELLGAKEYVVLDSNQAKLTSNLKPTGKADIRYSLSDSDGKQLTKEQSEYFKDSKMRDDNGNLKVMYHGSQDAGFHVFDSRFSDDDRSFFFVDRNDVAASYSGTSETYEAQTIRTAEDMNNFIESIGVEGYEVVEKDGKFTLLYEGDRVADSKTAQGIYDEFCWYEGVGEGDANYKVYLNLKNPLEIDAKGRPWNKIDAEFSQEVYDKYQSLTAEEKAALTDLAEWEDFRLFNSEIQEATGNELASAYAKMGEDVNIYDLFSVAADNFSEESMRENARKYLKTRDFAQRAKEQGYDGVIFKNIVDNGGYSNGSEGASTVAIAFESNQIKSVANEKPTGKADIRYSLSEDSKGRELSEEQREFFKDTKIKDKNGNLLVMYHGTKNGGFTVFQNKRRPNTEGFYFTNDRKYSNVFQGINNKTGKYHDIVQEGIEEGRFTPETYEVYLDVKNPFVLTADQQEIIEDIGYWENIYKPIKARGYDGVMMEDMSQVFVFNSNQIKRVDNTKPTSDPDIRFSLSVETDKNYLNAVNKGDTETARKIVEDVAEQSGYTIRAYHGTPNTEFTVFDKERLGKGNDQYGAGFYFATSKEAASHYGKRVIDSALNIKKPIRFTNTGDSGNNLIDADITLTSRQAYEVVKRLPNIYDAEESPLGDYFDAYWEVGAKDWMIRELAEQYRDVGYLDSDLFRNYPNELHDALRDVVGYDGVEVTFEGTGEKFYVAWFDNQIKSLDPVTYDDNGNVIPLSQRFNTENNDIRYSLTAEGETPKIYGNFNIYGKDVLLETAPVQEGIAENATTTEETVPKMEEVADEFAPITEEEANALQSERIDSFDDADVPPEVEAPYYGESEPVTADNPFEDRDIKEVGNRSVKAYMYENPEVKPFFQAEANIMLGELRDTVKGERFYTQGDVPGEYGAESYGVWGGTSRQTTEDIAYLLDNGRGNGRGYTYQEIEDGLNAIIEDNGAENNACSKRIEFLLNDRLMKGYYDSMGNDIPGNQDYINLLNEKQIIEYNDEARRSFFESADEYAPPVDDIAPVREVKAQTERVENIAPRATYETKAKRQVNGQRTMFEEGKTANILTEEPKTDKRKRSAWSMLKNNVFDKGMVFEDLSLKTGNRELQARWNSIRYADGKAQKLIGEGNASVSSLNSIREAVENSGKTEQFYEYLYHKHNVDRMSLEAKATPTIKALQGKFANLKDSQIKAIAAKKITEKTTEKTANTIREAREYLRALETKNKPVFGDSVTAEVSMEISDNLEKANPEFKEYAKEVYGYMNYLREMLVDGGVISSDTAKLWSEMYPHYVPIRRAGDKGLNINVPLDSGKTGVNAPIKRATGGNSDILPLFDTMGQRTIQTYKAIAKNRFGVELKNMLGTTISNEEANVDDTIDSIDSHEGLLQEGKNGKSPTFTVFENGERVTFEITDEMYDAIKPTGAGLSYTNKAANTVGRVFRGLLTEYNPVFMATNAVKDAQDILINSQHAGKTYAAIPKAIKQMATKGHWYQEYLANGGEQNTYFDTDTNTFKAEDEGFKKLIGMPLRGISYLNNTIEKVPRFAEYIASRESGQSVDVSMLDAARVTTNFAAGGDVTKFFNRNGFNFLNASMQGAVQQVRNVREAKANGLKGWLHLAAKVAVAGIPAMLLNDLLWDDDEEYEELSDYVKDNYYVVAKYDDGKFVRIPKGRTVAVIQDAFEQMGNLITGNDEVDLNNFLELAFSNLAPNNPLENNIIAPFIQVKNNRTWYGEDLVPTRLQDLPKEEQYDESTDSISRWLGENVPVFSPYQWNYLLNQYSGGIGDVFLPMLTPEAESGDNSLLGNITAPFKDKFTTDSVMNNQNVSDFYDTVDELTANAKSISATDKDVLKYKYMNSINAELSELYKQKREIQNGDLDDAVKYERVRALQSQIDSLARESLNTYNYVNINDGYATVGGLHFRLNDEGEWQKVSADQLDKQEEVTDGLGIDPSEYWSNKTEYDFAYKYPEKYAVAKSVGGYEKYKSYTSELYDIKADKDENGDTIRGSRKEKVIEYINNLDADYGERLILFKSEYKADDTYNMEIVEYLNSREDISYEEMESILKELGFTVKSDGTVTWD